jgi:hypothetical protein
VKLVAELRPGEVTETEVARIERDAQAGTADLGLRLTHIAMRFEHALQAARGLADSHLSNEAVRGLERAKWRLWHGRWTRCRRKLAALSRWTKRKHLRDVAGIDRIQRHVSELLGFDWYNQDHHHSGVGLMTYATG